MMKKFLQIGDKIEIVVHYGQEGKEKLCYSMIQDLLNNDGIVITMPMAAGDFEMLEPRQIVRINFFRSDGEFYFSALVQERFKMGSVVLVVVIPVSPVDRLQRRDFYRFKTILPVLFRIVDNNKPDQRYYKGHAMDISGGGMKLYTEKYVRLNAKLECKVKLDEQKEAVLTGKANRVRKIQDMEHGYDVGVTFADIPERVRDSIVAYIFDQQRRLKQKGLT